MSQTNGTIRFFENWKMHLVTDADLSSDVFKILLCSSSYVPDAENHEFLSDISGEVAGSGYSRQLLGGISLSLNAGTLTFDANDPVFAAVGGSFSARFWVIYDDSAPSKPLVCYGLLDETPADVIVTDGNTLTLNVNAAGLFTISGV